MMLKKLPLAIAATLVFCTGVLPAHAGGTPESVVIGRLTGTIHEPPHSLLGNSPTVGGDRGSVEFKGFRLVRADGKSFVIRPLLDGYFHQSLPPGEYALVRNRTDRPSYREEKVIQILAFTVAESSLINLGTIQIVLQGEPEESFFRASRPSEGTYIYRYRYQRMGGGKAASDPLKWFREKKRSAAGSYAGGVVSIDTEPTGLVDSSRYTLRETLFKLPLLNHW